MRLDFLLSLLDQSIDVLIAKAGRDPQTAGFLPGFGKPILWLDYYGDRALLGTPRRSSTFVICPAVVSITSMSLSAIARRLRPCPGT
jgi:hypothetical protein